METDQWSSKKRVTFHERRKKKRKTHIHNAAEKVSAILYFQCSTTPLDAASPSTRLWFTTCHRRGRQSNCFTLILRSRGSYRGRVSAHTRRPRKSIVVSSALIYARPGRFRPFRFALWPLTRFTWTAHDTSVVGPISRPLSACLSFCCSPLPLFERRGDFHTGASFMRFAYF